METIAEIAISTDTMKLIAAKTLRATGYPGASGISVEDGDSYGFSNLEAVSCVPEPVDRTQVDRNPIACYLDAAFDCTQSITLNLGLRLKSDRLRSA